MGSSDAVAPDWLVPGAKVVLHSVGGPGNRSMVRTATIKKVATQSFIVDKENEPRFKIQTMSARCGYGWSSYDRHVVRANSDEGRRLLVEARGRRLMAAADIAYEAWRNSRSAEHLAVLIGALGDVERHNVRG